MKVCAASFMQLEVCRGDCEEGVGDLGGWSQGFVILVKSFDGISDDKRVRCAF